MYLHSWQVHAYTAGMSNEMTQQQAVADLVRAGQVGERVHSRARWMATYQGVFAVGFGTVTMILGLVGPWWLRTTIFGVFWACLVVGMVWWARQQAAMPRVRRWRGAWGWAGTVVLYGTAVWIGSPALLGRVEYWLPAAVLVATPLGLVAWRARPA